jgi:casein kinase I family protein HRR25
MGIGKKSSMVYLVDFGLSKRYRDPRVNLHIPYREEQDFSGTFRYASICSHLRIENARRDDLESICYMLIYFLFGHLPWQNTTHETMELKERLILEKKMKISPSELCANIPIQFKNILEYCIELDYY